MANVGAATVPADDLVGLGGRSGAKKSGGGKEGDGEEGEREEG